MTLVLDDNQMKKAIKALMSHSEKVKESGATRQLFEDEGDVFNLQIALKKVPEKVSEKPVGLPCALSNTNTSLFFRRNDAHAQTFPESFSPTQSTL